MTSSSSSSKIRQPDEDPYKVLGLDFPVADDAVITKAYRKAALRCHPDKQQQSTSKAEAEAMAVQFHQLQQARAFLLDEEFRTSRQAYDRQRASEQARAAHERAQLDKLSGNRKRMQEELAAAEKQANLKKQKGRKSDEFSSSTKREDLKRQGQAMREAHAAAKAQQQQQREQEGESSRAARQVRLKWSRKRVKVSPSEDSIAKDFGEKFGPVEKVEMIGSKGNAALVTFRSVASCHPCVDYYQNSSEMRATFIQPPSSESAKEPATSTPSSRKTPVPQTSPTTTTSRDYESVAEWQARRAAARDALLQQQEQDDNEDSGLARAAKSASSQTPVSTEFLPKFPAASDSSLSYWDQLSALEEHILTPLIGHERMQELKKYV
eukprot:scaffold2093_cov161-Amphora_coffeaeformis.AAC.5